MVYLSDNLQQTDRLMTKTPNNEKSVTEGTTSPTPDPKETAEEKEATQANAESGENIADDELETLKRDLAECKDTYLRMLAEYDNYRKRATREKERMYLDVQAKTVGEFLPLIENLARAATAPCKDEAYKKGLDMTFTMAASTLEKLEVKMFGEKGDTFSPTLHNAVDSAEADDTPPGIVLEVYKPGYIIGDRVLSTAVVKVSE